MSVALRLSVFLVPLVAFAIWGSSYRPATATMIKDSSEDVEDLSLIDLPPLPAWANDPLPDFTRFHDTTEKKAAFFSFLYPRVVLANARILIQRHYLIALSHQKTLRPEEVTWLSRQAERLRVDADIVAGNPALFDALERRLDIVPPSLILAQAANESAWGTSRFARQGNNLFGQWCFSDGCGIVPKRRVEGANHEVAAFKSPYGSIRAYIQNLNRHASYKPLRKTREQERERDMFPTGRKLAAGLMSYSERGKAYVREIRHMIDYNNLSYYDSQYTLSIGYDPDQQALMQTATAGESELLPGSTNKGG